MLCRKMALSPERKSHAGAPRHHPMAMPFRFVLQVDHGLIARRAGRHEGEEQHGRPAGGKQATLAGNCA
jgi:hypothetical protein